jgi:hypothetical protein
MDMKTAGSRVGKILEQVCVMTLEVPLDKYKLCFGKRLWDMTPERYIWRFRQFGYPIMVAALVYFDRLLQKKVPATPLSMYRLIAGCYQLALKYWEDYPMCTRKKFSLICGFSVDELNRLERNLFAWMDYQLGIAPASYDTYNELLKNFSI